MIEFDPELLRRYGVSAPRYTSYPTALQFHEGISTFDYMTAASAVPADAPVSIYVHVPFCASPCYYCACNRVITRQVDMARKYAARMIQEVPLRASYFRRPRPAVQIHFGGGTPTFLSTEILLQIMQAIGCHFPLTDESGRDYSIEIDPRTLTRNTLADLRQMGFNRLSLGVQDFDPRVQRLVNRDQPEAMVQAALSEARRLGYSSVNFDLIYGLPAQTLDTFANTLRRVIEMRPDRIAMYGYAHLPKLFRPQRRFDKLRLPDASERIALLGLGIEKLSHAGYVHIGMDHFALAEDALAMARDTGTLQRSFQGYTTHGELDLINLGASAIGRVGGLFVQNAKSLHGYGLAIDSGQLPTSRGVFLTRDDQIRSDVIQQIMCQRRIVIEKLEMKWGLRFATYFERESEALRSLQADGLLSVTPAGIDITARGEYLLRNIALVFDAYALRGADPVRAAKAI